MTKCTQLDTGGHGGARAHTQRQSGLREPVHQEGSEHSQLPPPGYLIDSSNHPRALFQPLPGDAQLSLMGTGCPSSQPPEFSPWTGTFLPSFYFSSGLSLQGCYFNFSDSLAVPSLWKLEARKDLSILYTHVHAHMHAHLGLNHPFIKRECERRLERWMGAFFAFAAEYPGLVPAHDSS